MLRKTGLPQLSLVKCWIVTFCLVLSLNAKAQNLPSLLNQRNTNSTFAIVAYDSETQKWGIAVATNNIYVGNSTIYIAPGVGAAAVIAETEPIYGINALKKMRQGFTPAQAANFTLRTDSMPDYRQLGIVDKFGHSYGYTGHALSYWKGTAAHITGKGYVVMGNQLADSVLVEMVRAYETTHASFPQRLIASIAAGQQAGGQITGKQSAALKVDGLETTWNNRIDLRVDNDTDPIPNLKKLLNYHEGRIILNKSMSAIRDGKRDTGRIMLQEAEPMLKGWLGIYSKLTAAHIMLGEEDKAIDIIKDALAHEKRWKENLPAFYYLYEHKSYRELVDTSAFSEKDWGAAVQQELNMEKNKEALALVKQMISKYPTSSNLQYLQALALQSNGDIIQARKAIDNAVKLDPQNGDAKRMIKEKFGKR
jgi:uncharacterized Ntn-hydrolase superfamily protein